MIKLYFDLKLLLVFPPPGFGINRSGEGNEQRKKHFFANHGFLTPLRIEEMYSPLSRRLQGPIVYLFKSILHDGIRAINLSRKSQGHRSMFNGLWKVLWTVVKPQKIDYSQRFSNSSGLKYPILECNRSVL